MNNKFWVSIVVIVWVCVTVMPSTVQALGLAKIKVIVIDESGSPIDGAHLNIRFSSGSGTIKGYTDEQGVFETKAMSNDGVILGDITKNGYYESGIAHSFYVTRFGIWQPFGKELIVVMRPIINPVPMYAIDKAMKFPAFGSEVGFDLMKADWVIPHGQGTHPDFIFKVERRYDNTDNYDVVMNLTFSNPFDGIQVVLDDGGGDFNVGSNFRLPRMAPEAGYQPKLQRRLTGGSYGSYQDGFNDSKNFIFRVRSEVDEDGKLKRAMYGKISGDLNVYTSGAISMDYYLNPDYTRNLEFDYKRNLFHPVSKER